MMKTKVQSTRVLLVSDSTMGANFHLLYLLRVVNVMTPPLATIDDNEDVMKVTFMRMMHVFMWIFCPND